MHALTLAELASTFVSLAPAMLAQRRAPSVKAGQTLWTNSRSRYDEWVYRLAAHRDALNNTGSTRRTRKWDEILPMLQEVLLSEPLTRTIACFAATLEQQQINDELSPLMQSVLVSHVEARHRCLHLIVFGRGLPVESAVRLNQLRRGLECYSDQLLAAMPASTITEPFAFDEGKVHETRRSLQGLKQPGAAESEWLRLHLHTLVSDLWRKLQIHIDWRAANGRLNHHISQSVLGLLPCELFTSLGLPQTAGAYNLGRSHSPESDGKSTDPAVAGSPLQLLMKTPHRRNNTNSTNDRRW